MPSELKEVEHKKYRKHGFKREQSLDEYWLSAKLEMRNDG